jgi:hypothetical protein
VGALSKLAIFFGLALIALLPLVNPVGDALVFLGLSACSRASTATTLDCSGSSEIRHILRIHADGHTVDDLAFTPERTGTAVVTDAFYILRFKTDPGSSFLFRINRMTTDGSRALIGEDGKTVEGHRGFARINCKPYDGKPISNGAASPRGPRAGRGTVRPS